LTFKVYGEVQGSLSNVTCAVPSTATYSTTSGKLNAGSYTLVCAGSPSTSDTDGVTYNAPYNDGTPHTPGVLTISKRPITVTATSDTKEYDGTTSSGKTPTITSGSLATGDTNNFIQVFDSRNSGPRTLTASGTVGDGNGGNNYTYNFVTASGSITKRPITVTAAPNTKIYDGTISAAALPVISAPGLVIGDTANFTETYDNANAGTNKTLTPSGSVNDGNSGNNYSVTLVPSNTGVIVGYSFSGFFSPLTTAGSPTVPSDSGTFNFNRVLAFKWQLRDLNGNQIVDLNTLASFVVVRNESCVVGPANGAAVQLYSPITGTAGGTTFRYDTGGAQYLFKWDPTKTSPPGCYNISVGFKDNTSHATLVKLQ